MRTTFHIIYIKKLYINLKIYYYIKNISNLFDSFIL